MNRSIKLDIRIDIRNDIVQPIVIYSAYAPIPSLLEQEIKASIDFLVKKHLVYVLERKVE